MAKLDEVIALAQKTGRIHVSPDMVDVAKTMPQLTGLEVVVSRFMSAGTLVAFELPEDWLLADDVTTLS